MEYQYGQNNNQNEQGYSYYGGYDNGSYGSGGYTNQNSTGRGNKKKNSGNGGLIVLCLICSLLVGTIGGAVGATAVNSFMNKDVKQESSASSKKEEKKEDLKDTTASSDSVQNTTPSVAMATTANNNLNVEQIVEIGMPSVVAITNIGATEIRSMWGTFTQESKSAGSGVIIGKTDTELLIATNYHVVEDSEQLNVLFSYQESDEEPSIVNAKIKDYDEEKDIAVIAVQMQDLTEENLNNIAVAKIGSSDDLHLGEQVVAIGNALGYGQSVTTGIVSALSRNVSINNNGTQIKNNYLQIDAAINPGNSGGALFNMRGEVVGINGAKAMSTGSDGVGWSIPISSVIDEIEGMMQTEIKEVVEESKRGYLGIAGSNVTPDISRSYGIPEGVYLSTITDGSPADKAGLKKGMVVTKLNGKNVKNMSALKEYLSYYKVGETVSLTLQVPTGNEGEYEEKVVDIVLGTSLEAGMNVESENQKQQQEQQQQQQQQQMNPFGGFFPFFGQ